MIARIVPAVRLPVKAPESFDYAIPEELAPAIVPGAVVIVPFAGRRVAGLVLAISETAAVSKSLKSVSGLAKGFPPISKSVLAAWTRLVGIFATTWPRFCWLALPAVPARAIATAPFGMPPVPAAGPGASLSAVFVNEPGDQAAAVRKTIESAKGRQVLLLVPTVREAAAWAKETGGQVWHSSLSAGAKYSLACAAAAGAAKIVVGTKSAALLPFSGLYSVIVIAAGSASHKQEDSDPRFDARIAAEELCSASGAKLVCLDPWPPLGRWKALNASRPLEAKVHDLADAAKREKAKVLVDDPLLESLERAVAAGGRALLIMNRRGTSSSLICRDCGTPVACPDCGLPLASHPDRLTCSADEKSYPLPDGCAKCRSLNLKPIGAGSKALFDFLKKRFPEAAIAHLDRDDAADPDAAQIVVGTTAVFRALAPRFRPFDLAADAFLGAGTGRSAYDSVEESSRILRTLAASLAPGGELHVQTPDAAAPALLALRDPKSALAAELSEREAFGYPPAKIMISALGSGPTEAKLLELASSAAEELRRAYPAAEIGDPVWGRPKLFRKKYRLSLQVKMPMGTDYSGLLRLLPEGFAIEPKML